MFGAPFFSNPFDTSKTTDPKAALAIAIARDNRLTKQEERAKQDALIELELGPKWWLRAHP